MPTRKEGQNSHESASSGIQREEKDKTRQDRTEEKG